MSRSNSTVASPDGNGPTKVPLALGEKNSKAGLTIDTKSPPYAGPLSPLTPDSPGLRPRDAYDSLPPWRTAIRNKLLESLEWQSAVLANMQVSNHASLVSTLRTDSLVQRLECARHG